MIVIYTTPKNTKVAIRASLIQTIAETADGTVAIIVQNEPIIVQDSFSDLLDKWKTAEYLTLEKRR